MTLVLITRRSLVQILSPQPVNSSPYGKNRKGFFLSLQAVEGKRSNQERVVGA